MKAYKSKQANKEHIKTKKQIIIQHMESVAYKIKKENRGNGGINIRAETNTCNEQKHG